MQYDRLRDKDTMGEQLPLQVLLPDMMSTQLLAADVYATYLKHSREHEAELWSTMLHHELNHVRFVAMLMDADSVPNVTLPSVRMDMFRDLCARARLYAPESAFERTLWALRLEHAQIDFGVEALAARRVGGSPDTPVYPGPVEDHYAQLLQWADRYRGAREVAVQMARIEEHIPRKTGPSAESSR